jgi:DNA-binding response OmpR family regulator
MRILLIEDDRMIATSLAAGLEDDGFAIDCVGTAEAALVALQDAQANYSLVLLDWGLPGISGLELLAKLRQRGSLVPVLMLTAHDSLQDRVTGLDSGADDYLTKPFELAELKARIRSLLRRNTGRAEPELTHGGLTLNPATHEATSGATKVSLSAREFALLHALLERPGQLLSRAQLEERLYAWNSAVESNAIEFIIHGVRRKLGHGWIENVRGVGWRIGKVS